MNKCRWLILLALIFGCNSSSNSEKAVVKKSQMPIDTQTPFISDIYLNGVIQAKDNFKRVTHYLGMPDSVMKQDGKMIFIKEDSSVLYYYFKDIEFVNDNGVMVLEHIPLANHPDLYLQTN